MPDHPLLPRAIAALGEPLREDDLARALGLPPASAAADLALDEMLRSGRLVELGDGRIAAGENLLAGVVLWHRVDSVEVAMRRVSFGVDILSALEVVPDRGEILIGDEAVPLLEWYGPGDPDVERGPTVRLPPGWGGGLQPGDLVALTLDGLNLRLRRSDDPALPCGPAAGSCEAEALGAALHRLAGERGRTLTLLRDGDRDDDDQWVLDLEVNGGILVTDHGAALKALHRLPLREAIVRAGFTGRAHIVAGPGVSAQSLETFLVGWAFAVGVSVDSPWVFEACGVVLCILCGPLGDDPAEAERASADPLRRLLDDPLVAELVTTHLRQVHLGVAAEAERRLRPVHLAHPAEPGPTWARAVALLRQGRAVEAHDALDVVVDGFDDDGFALWPLLVRCAGGLRAVSGDLPSAVALARRAGWDEDADALSRWLPRPPDVARNERCPCGSGAKAKVCCLRHPAAPPIGGRLPLLWHKLAGWTLTQGGGSGSDRCLVGSAMDPTGALAAEQAMIADDVAFLEGGDIGTVLDEIGSLLPSDEADVAARWRFGRHAVWVVDRVGSEGPVWRDASTDEHALVIGTVRPTQPVPDLRPGTYVVASLLPGPSGHVLAGAAVTVPAAKRDRVLGVVRAGVEPLLLMTLWELLGVIPDGFAWPDAA